MQRNGEMQNNLVGSACRFPPHVLAPLLLAVSTLSLNASPQIENVSGAVIHGESLVLSGTEFGTKSPAAPIKWDDFEAGAPGADLSGWTLYSSGGTVPRYVDTPVRTGSTRSAHSDFTVPNNYNCSFQLLGGSWSTLFISFYHRTDYSCYSGGACYEGQGARNSKVMRIEGNNGSLGSPQGEGVPLLAIPEKTKPNNGTDVSSIRVQYDPSLVGDTHYYGGSWNHQSWEQATVHIDIAPSAPNKELHYWRDFQDVTRYDSNADELQQMGLGGSVFNEIKLGFYFSSGSTANRYIDDVYIDNTRAHVEICDTSTYAARTDCAMQIPTTWSSTSIGVTVNKGSFDASQEAYIYVTDSAGNVNTNGYPLTFGAGGGNNSETALPPTNVKRADKLPTPGQE